MSNHLRQRTWGIFVKPYVVYSEAAIVRDTVKTSGSCGGGDVVAQGGEPWMLHKKTTSFAEARDIVKGIIDELGLRMGSEIMVTEIIPTDHIITPLA